MIRLGVNIDHVATLRNARGGVHPCPVRAALAAQAAGADGITAHLREDRRHIRDADMRALKERLDIPVNFEMAATEEMQALALELRPHAVCLVPEKREELTTEGGLDVAGQQARLTDFIVPLREVGIRVSCFIEASITQVDASARAGATCVEFHTGHYCLAEGDARATIHAALCESAQQAEALGLECHGGHGLDYDTAPLIAAVPQIVELNIGHFLMGEAMFVGLDAAITRMKHIIQEAS